MSAKGQAALRTFVTFRTEQFNKTEVREDFINPCCFGEDCAKWLTERMRSSGWPEVSEPWQEDWGWMAEAKHGNSTVLIAVTLMEDDDPEWLVYLHEKFPLLKRLFGGAGPSVLPGMVEALHSMLSASAGVRDIGWHFQDLFDRGLPDGAQVPGAPRPA